LDSSYIYISSLPEDHPFRNTKLGLLEAEYCPPNSTSYFKVYPAFTIAKVSYNKLGTVWVKDHIWRMPYDKAMEFINEYKT